MEVLYLGTKNCKNVQMVREHVLVQGSHESQAQQLLSLEKRRLRGGLMAAYRSSQGSAELCLLVTATGPKGTNMELHQGRLGVRRRFCTRGQQAGSKLAELKELLDSALRHQFLDSCGAGP